MNRTSPFNLMSLLRDVGVAWRLLWDPRVPGLLKLALPVLALLYWISPLDLLPGLPFDDIAILLIAARMFVSMAPRESVNNAFNGNRRATSNGYASNGFYQNGRQSTSNGRRDDDDPNTIDTTWRVVDD